MNHKRQNKSILISVVLPTYNGETHIKEAIQSVLDQTVTNFELLVIDDHSTDASAKIVAEFNDKRLIYIKKDKNTGIADSLNYGVKQARGKYIARMDDDDICLPNRFEEQLKILENNDSIIVCGSNVLIRNGKIEKQNPEFHERIKMELLFHNPMTHPSVMIRRDVLLKHIYNPKMVPSEDYDLWSRLIWIGNFYNIQKPLLIYRSHKNSETTKRRREQLILNVCIVNTMFIKLGLSISDQCKKNINYIVAHNYKISGEELKKISKSIFILKKTNQKEQVFNVNEFNIFLNTQLKKYLIAYFENQKFKKKIFPFFKINSSNKLMVLKYYIKKIL